MIELMMGTLNDAIKNGEWIVYLKLMDGTIILSDNPDYEEKHELWTNNKLNANLVFQKKGLDKS